ncbi:tetratricopeptide repeat protein [Oceanidesulfovibrio marinus]|uniref:MBL fold metallo-hydrolase n=1 Tax=Oceanidesulfovibrio marinus TaxID=370038 RepID=A0ABX6NCK7_9BACT|nr:tetratricopeptide repeat protein [Oceanidesulfovibrio marinus]QJT08076.1 MBL fold metallo-hydrolase [Oceanidesulfovibrio marinus]
MTNEEITREFLQLLAGDWDDSAVHRGFNELQERVSGQGEWARIIEARLFVLEKKTEKAITLLEEIRGRDSEHHAASLMLVRILNQDIRNYGKALGVLDHLLSKGFEGQVAPEWFEAMTLGEKVYALASESRCDEALKTADQLLGRFGEAREPFLVRQVARALYNKGTILGKQGKPEEEIRVYEEVARCFGEATEPGILEQVGRALVNKGAVLGKQGKPEEATQVFEEVARRLGEIAEPGILAQVARALLNKGVILGLQGKPEEASRIFEEVARRFGESTEPGILEQVSKALVDKGLAFSQLGKPEEASRIFGEVARRFGEATEPGILEQVARALVNKGAVLGKQGKPEATQVFEEVARRFGEATEPGILEQVARALVNKGVAFEQQGKSDEASQVYEEVARRFGEVHDPLLRKWVFEAKLRKSLTLFEMKQRKEARKLFDSIQKELLQKDAIKEELTYLYTIVARRFPSKMRSKDSQQRKVRMKRDLTITGGDVEANLEMVLSHMLEEIDLETQNTYFKNMEAAKTRTDRFITEDAHFNDKFSFLLVLREWNSYTPVIPSAEESDRGGGYYIRHAGEGIVIDPGYDFIENFHRTGGRLGGIDHIIVTHAHDDHTAELEALLMLFQRRMDKEDLPKKQVNLYLSAGVQRKFAGLLDLRDLKYGNVVTLCPSTTGYEQRIQLNKKTVLTVLPAYHDDVITRQSAVGLGFEFDTENGTRKVVFTGDSGLYPRDCGSDGVERYYDDGQSPKLKTGSKDALFKQYPKAFRNSPHLVIAHIGSIKKREFGLGEVPSPGEIGSRFYPNHLGLLGTLMLLKELNPDAAVISEFGAELKGFHIDLVQKLGQALNKVQGENNSNEKSKTFVVAGDLTTVYNITTHSFLSHTQYNTQDSFEFREVDTLACLKAKDFFYKPKWVQEIEVSERKGSERAYLFTADGRAKKYDLNAKHFAKHFFARLLPYQKHPITNEEEFKEAYG